MSAAAQRSAAEHCCLQCQRRCRAELQPITLLLLLLLLL